MVKISDFDNVLEVAFGLNALFYFFDLIPHTEERIDELEKRHAELYKRKVELTKNTYAFPIGFVVSSTYPFYNRIFVRVSIIMSLVLLGFMLYSSFRPAAQMKVFYMCLLLVFAYGTPLIALVLHRGTIAFAEAANRELTKEIHEAEYAAEKYTMNLGEHYTLINPRMKDVRSALSSLTTDANVPYILISKRKETFIKVTGRRKTGFIVEYQEGDPSHYYKSNQPCEKDQVAEMLSFYLVGNAEWKDITNWERR